MVLKNFYIFSISFFLFVCSICIGQIIYDKYVNKGNIILVESDFFSKVDIKDVINENKSKNLFNNCKGFDCSFKVALFYSDLSIVILNKSKKEQDIKRYVGDLHMRSLKKWDALAEKDKSMLFFKHYYIKMYKKNLESITN